MLNRKGGVAKESSHKFGCDQVDEIFIAMGYSKPSCNYRRASNRHNRYFAEGRDASGQPVRPVRRRLSQRA